LKKSLIQSKQIFKYGHNLNLAFYFFMSTLNSPATFLSTLGFMTLILNYSEIYI